MLHAPPNTLCSDHDNKDVHTKLLEICISGIGHLPEFHDERSWPEGAGFQGIDAVRKVGVVDFPDVFRAGAVEDLVPSEL